MLFNSSTFLIFFLIVFFIHSSPITRPWRKINLLIASYIFYAAWNPPFVLLLWISTLTDWYAAKGIAQSRSKIYRRVFLGLSLAINLGLLGFFKYGNFLLENFTGLLRLVHIHYQPLPLDIVLPVGISFYTFQTLSYTFDVYKRKEVPAESFLDYALYVTFFPQLVAGPIVRSGEFLPQCKTFSLASWNRFFIGVFLMTLGLFEKVVIADFLVAPVADKVYGASGLIGTADAWLGTFAFSVQIFCDFAGYSTCAIGTALCLGFTLPKNFQFPYAAKGFSDFWQRWHISLSTWMRDYLYIPLGGGRQGTARTLLNLWVTMFLAGLWHGAAWTFVLWGWLHGIYLIAEHLFCRLFSRLQLWRHVFAKAFLMTLTYLAVCYGWMLFRSRDFAQIFNMSRSMFTFNSNGNSLLSSSQCLWTSAVTLMVLAVHWKFRDRSLLKMIESAPRFLTVGSMLMMIIFLWIVPKDGRAFIYFQF